MLQKHQCLYPLKVLKVEIIKLDICNYNKLKKIIFEFKPNIIFI